MEQPARMTTLSLEFDRGSLVLSPAGLELSDVPTGFVLDPRIGGRYRAEACWYRRAVGTLTRSSSSFVDRARNYTTLQLSQRHSLDPFPHQQEALAEWDRSERSGIVILPTGAGKSFLAIMAMQVVQRSTLIVVPTLDLLTQWTRVVSSAFGIDVGVVGGGEYSVSDITVTTYDSAYRHMDRFGDRFGLIVFDEVHHLPSDTYAQAAKLAIAPYRLGLTATLERPDGAHHVLDTLVGPVVYRKSVTDLKGVYLSDYEVRRINVALTPDERSEHDKERGLYLEFIKRHGIRLGGPRGWQQFLRATNKSAEGRRALRAYHAQRHIAMASESKMEVLRTILETHAQEPCVFFANDNRTVYEVSRRFLVPVITHETPAKERRRWLDGLAAGRIRAVGTSRVLNEGVDMPDVSVGIILSGTGSVREHVQRLGRILRHREGKLAILYELVTADTAEPHTSRRRREHEAYREC